MGARLPAGLPASNPGSPHFCQLASKLPESLESGSWLFTGRLQPLAEREGEKGMYRSTRSTSPAVKGWRYKLGWPTGLARKHPNSVHLVMRTVTRARPASASTAHRRQSQASRSPATEMCPADPRMGWLIVPIEAKPRVLPHTELSKPQPDVAALPAAPCLADVRTVVLDDQYRSHLRRCGYKGRL